MQKWTDFRQMVYRQLTLPEVKAKFRTIVIDTADVAYDLCEKYIMAQAGVDNIKDIPYGQGWARAEKEFDEVLRAITLEGYGLVLISHAEDKVFVDENGVEYNKIVPTLSKRARKVVLRMTDINAFAKIVEVEEGVFKPKLFLRGTPRYEAGSRFKYIEPVIDFTYEELVRAINDAIDKQQELDGAVVVDENRNADILAVDEVDFDEVMAEAQMVCETLLKADQANAEKIKRIIERNLGVGKKLSECTPIQADIVDVIVKELKALV